MIRAFIASLALSTLCIPEVQATTTFTEIDLLNHFEQHGGRVYIDSDVCDRPVFGMQQGTTVHICATNHQGNAEELKDTIRHEVWHVVQACNNGTLSDDPIYAIVQAHEHGWTGEGYSKPEHWHFEAEAHLAAALLTPEQIKDELNNYCLSE